MGTVQSKDEIGLQTTEAAKFKLSKISAQSSHIRTNDILNGLQYKRRYLLHSGEGKKITHDMCLSVLYLFIRFSDSKNSSALKGTSFTITGLM